MTILYALLVRLAAVLITIITYLYDLTIWLLNLILCCQYTNCVASVGRNHFYKPLGIQELMLDIHLFYSFKNAM